MPDLDQLLAEDARVASQDTPPPALDTALRRAHMSLRRRRLAGGGVALAAVAAVGGGLYAAASPSSGGGPRLAAYDRVLGADPSNADHVIVVGPDDEHVARCTKVPGAKVTLARSSDGDRVTGYGATYRGSHGGPQVQVGLVNPDGRDLPPGPYYVFSCPRN